jgi:hypothetical protein
MSGCGGAEPPSASTGASRDPGRRPLHGGSSLAELVAWLVQNGVTSLACLVAQIVKLAVKGVTSLAGYLYGQRQRLLQLPMRVLIVLRHVVVSGPLPWTASAVSFDARRFMLCVRPRATRGSRAEVDRPILASSPPARRAGW